MIKKKIKEVGLLKEKYKDSKQAYFLNMGHRDDDANECYTRREDADKLVHFLTAKKIIEKNYIIWLPFNDYHSNIYDSLKDSGYNNLIATDDNFFLYEPDDYDIIISNPPFQNRTKLFNRLFSLRHPFVILNANMFFNNCNMVYKLIQYSDRIAFLCPSRRMYFIRNGIEDSDISAFYSFWLCFDVGLQGWIKLPNITGQSELPITYNNL